MSECPYCGFKAKPSHAEDWFIPHEFCSKECFDNYTDEGVIEWMKEMKAEKYRNEKWEEDR